MIIREVREEEKEQFNSVATHPLQSWEWGEFRKNRGSEVIRLGVFNSGKIISGLQLYSTIFPHTEKKVWLLLRGPMPNAPILESLRRLAVEKNAIFIKIEPDVGGVITGDHPPSGHEQIANFLLAHGCQSGKPFFASHSFWIDLSQTEEQLLASMKEKTRYNIKLSTKYKVIITENNSDQAFSAYLDLMFTHTTQRHNFRSHDENYHRQMWQILARSDDPRAHLLTATYQNEILAAWILFKFHDTLYYPYGASSQSHKEVMASSGIMWESILFGKKIGCKKFDLWGAAAPDYSPQDPWAGFTKFKEGFGGNWISYVGSFDMVTDFKWYKIYKLAEKTREITRKLHLPINL